jgi:hypothetical protein
MLGAHILFSVVGILGSFTWTMSFFYIQKHGESLRVLRYCRIGKWATLLGIVSVVVTGTIIFMGEPQVFLASRRFIFNMSLMAVLLAVEVVSFRTYDREVLRILRLISPLIWSCIFFVALIVPL